LNIENVSTLKINKLSQAQYERELAAGRIDENALYLTPDNEISTLADLMDDAEHRTVTDAEKKVWNEKVDQTMLSNYALKETVEANKDAVDAHVAETNPAHITDAERTKWNAKSDFSGDYNDLENAPNITEDGSNNLVITDPDGNVIFRSDGSGFETTTLTVDEAIVGGVNVNDFITNHIHLPEVTDADNGKILMVVNGKWQAVSLNLSVDENGVLSI
jgi:hypothetical protein